MAIQFNCPHCGVLYKLDDKFAGKTGKCKNAKCQQPILIPYQSTTDSPQPKPHTQANPIDAETLAAQLLGETPAPPPEANGAVAAPSKRIDVTCSFCDHKFDVDASMAGKNTTCPECRKIIRVPKPVEQKAADWRTGNNNRPSLAKVDEPAPAGAWDAQRKGVSGEALRKAGALEVEEPEDPDERRIRRIKQVIYGLLLTGIVVFVALYVARGRREGERERWMEMAVKEMESWPKKPELHAAIECDAGEHGVRSADSRDKLIAAVDWFNKSRDHLQAMPVSSDDRNALLIELASSLPVCGGTATEVNDDKRLPWDQVHPMIRKCVDKLPPHHSELRRRAFSAITRKLAEKDQAPLAVTIARNSTAEAEQPETIGRVGIELFLMGKKDQAEQVLAKLEKYNQPAATALALALKGGEMPSANFLPLSKPERGPRAIPRDSVLAYGEGRALQERFSDAMSVAKMGATPADRADTLVRIAVVANALGKPDQAGPAIEGIVAEVKSQAKGPGFDPWLLITAIEQAARANRNEAVQVLLDALPDDRHRSWGKLGLLRLKLAAQPKDAKADETWLELPTGDLPNVAQGLAQAEVARHNAAGGDSSYAGKMKKVTGPLKAFGLAGAALGALDREKK